MRARSTPLTHDDHRKRHQELHRALDELFADFIRHHPERHQFLSMPLRELLDWAYQQSVEPTEPLEESKV